MTSRAALLALVAALAVASRPAAAGRVRRPTRSSSERSRTPPRAATPTPRCCSRGRRGIRAIVLSAVWTPPLEAPPAAELAALEKAVIAAATNGIRPIVAVYSFSSVTPTTPAARAQFAAYAASIPRSLPGVRDVIVGNEPNLNLFWLPQFGPDGSDAAAASYLALLAESYDALKDVSPDINVIGGSLSARGSDDPAGSRPTHSPTRFIEDLGAAYRASGRDKPVMDMFSIHPYPENSSIPPDFEHPQSTSIGLADYDKLVGSARRGLRRHRPAGLLAADRLRRVRPPDGDPASRSSGGTPAPSRRRRSRSTRQAQADPIRRRDRDRRLPPDRADAALLPRLGRAAARAAPDRRLLRRRHTEVEPGDDRPRGPRRPGAAPGVPVGGRGKASRRSTAPWPTEAPQENGPRRRFTLDAAQSAAERPLGRDRVGARPRRLRGSHRPSRRRLGRAFLRLSPLLRDRRRRRGPDDRPRRRVPAAPRCVDRNRGRGHLVRDGGVPLAVSLLEQRQRAVPVDRGRVLPGLLPRELRRPGPVAPSPSAVADARGLGRRDHRGPGGRRDRQCGPDRRRPRHDRRPALRRGDEHCLSARRRDPPLARRRRLRSHALASRTRLGISRSVAHDQRPRRQRLPLRDSDGDVQRRWRPRCSVADRPAPDRDRRLAGRRTRSDRRHARPAAARHSHPVCARRRDAAHRRSLPSPQPRRDHSGHPHPGRRSHPPRASRSARTATCCGGRPTRRSPTRSRDSGTDGA